MNEKRYSIGQLARMSGVSVRTLHHYDQKGLLVPQREPNGYRSYGHAEVRRLQQILLYRQCGMELSQIAHLLDDPSFSERAALEDQLARLRAQAAQLESTMSNVERTLDALRRDADMTDSQRFEGLKRQTIERNERTYGKEARKRHGDEAIDAANQALLAMDEATWTDMQALEQRIKELLVEAMRTQDTVGDASAALVKAHARWLSLHWGHGAYSPEAHRNLADGYLADERYIAYYDGACGKGATQFLRDAIHALA